MSEKPREGCEGCRLFKEIADLKKQVEEKGREIDYIHKVIQWSQAILTALNVGDVMRESKLHLKLREVMIAYRHWCLTGERQGKREG